MSDAAKTSSTPRARARHTARAADIPDRDNRRVWIEHVTPEIDAGRFPIKRVIGEQVDVEADVFADGHDTVACVLLYRQVGDARWHEIAMTALGNDRWHAAFRVTELGGYTYTIEGWPDTFTTWRVDLLRRIEVDQDTDIDMRIGADLIRRAATRAPATDAARLESRAARLSEPGELSDKRALALDDELVALMRTYPDRRLATRYGREPGVTVNRVRASFSTWYELFPRSCAPEPGRHGTFRDCEAWLDYVASMGFDVLYLPPIHPIGEAVRKGRNNAVTPEPDDVGSPWAIGSAEGGHTAIHPALGTFDDLDRLRAKAAERHLELALDIAFQCTPDHPWVTEHPHWFRRRPDGTIQYAENPPKTYQDIYPLDFENDDWRALWDALKDVLQFWIDRGFRIFRVDNPHTKPFRFWEWVIGELKRSHADLIFLSEAFTRPKVMYQLAKLGFDQSYTYFTWRNTKWDLTQYFTEITRTEVREFFRPNLWPNTPDILAGYLQAGGRPAFITRLVLAGSLGASYGIYGPAFELCENTPRQAGSEEYLNSEKYELKHPDLDAPWSLRDLIRRVNRARHENPALQSDTSLRFHQTDNDLLLCYSKATPDGSNVIVAVVNLDFQYKQSGWVTLDLAALGLGPQESYAVHDLLTDHRYRWHGPTNYVELNPQHVPAHLLRVTRTPGIDHDSGGLPAPPGLP